METKRSIGPVTGSATLGSAIGVIIVWILTYSGIDVPEVVQLAIVALLSALGGWLIKPGTGTRRK